MLVRRKPNHSWLSLADRTRCYVGCLQSTRSPRTKRIVPGDPQEVRNRVFIAADALYIKRFAEPLLRSIQKNSPDTHVHLHVLPGQGQGHLLEDDALVRDQVSVSWSHGNRPETFHPAWREREKRAFYLTSARFIGFRDLMIREPQPTLFLDADSIVTRPLNPLFARQRDRDVSLFLRLRRSAPWKRAFASAAYFAPTPSSLRFCEMLGGAAERMLRRPLDYHVDQMLLYAAYRVARMTMPSTSFGLLDRSYADWDFNPQSPIWSAKGARKGQLPL